MTEPPSGEGSGWTVPFSEHSAPEKTRWRQILRKEPSGAGLGRGEVERAEPRGARGGVLGAGPGWRKGGPLGLPKREFSPSSSPYFLLRRQVRWALQLEDARLGGPDFQLAKRWEKGKGRR